MALTATGCNDIYTDLSDLVIIPVNPTLGPSLTASRVYGQLGSFTSNTYNKNELYPGVPSAENLFYPGDVAAGADGVYIADSGNNRVLYYPGRDTTASRVYGQSGSFIISLPNTPALNANSLSSPAGIALDADGVYIADSGNNRVLYYYRSSTAATRVYGQGGSYDTNGSNHDGLSADSLSEPQGVAVDSGGVYIADTGNNRVLYYAGAETTASRVYGQSGSFTASTANNGGISANSLNRPIAVAVDADGVYISDKGNHRVLYYPGASTTATRVYGQFGNFTTNTANNGGVSADSLSSPSGIEAAGGGLYVSDNQNNRVLYFSGARTTATRVFGQSGSFTTNTANNGGISARSLWSPMGLAASGGGLYIVDDGNSRVLWH